MTVFDLHHIILTRSSHFAPPVSEEKKRELAEANGPHFSIRLKDTEVLERTFLRFMVKVKGDPQPKIKL